MENFYSFFNLGNEGNPDVFVNKVNELQSNLSIKKDWLIWPGTLKSIYLNYYIYEQDKLNNEAKKRLDIYKDMEWYNEIDWVLNWSLDPFSKKTFLWNDIWINIPWTYINENVSDLFPENINNVSNLITFKNINWKTAVAFYINWKLELATFWSPWIDDGKHSTPKVYTKWQRSPSKLHYSTDYPEKKAPSWKIISKWWAVMPYAVHVDWPVWIHWSDSKIDWNPRSHWCVRLWLYYVEHIYEMIKKLWVSNVIIDTRNIY